MIIENSLLMKYIMHVSVAEGVDFATNVNLSPAGMGEFEFTDEEKDTLTKEYFPEVRRLRKATFPITKKWEVWREGYYASGCEGTPAKAHKYGEIEAESFQQACELLLADNQDFDPKGLNVWGCRLFDNEIDARESFG